MLRATIFVALGLQDFKLNDYCCTPACKAGRFVPRYLQQWCESLNASEERAMSRTTAELGTRQQDLAATHRAQAYRAWLIGRIALYTSVVLLGIMFALPFIWMISTSLKDDPQTFKVPPIWIPNPMRFA